MQAAAARITTTVDTTSVASRKRDALRAHASQLAESWFAKMPDSLFDEVFGVESFIREQDRTAAPIPEVDLFAGLRPRRYVVGRDPVGAETTVHSAVGVLPSSRRTFDSRRTRSKMLAQADEKTAMIVVYRVDVESTAGR